MVQKGGDSYTGLNGQAAQAPYRNSLSARGWLLGGSLRYNLGPSWYLSGRAGWFQASTTAKFQSDGWASGYSDNATGGYAGLGAGYNLTRAWSLDSNGGHVNSYSATAEYRF